MMWILESALIGHSTASSLLRYKNHARLFQASTGNNWLLPALKRYYFLKIVGRSV